MSLNNTVSAERIHIGFFGLRNAGKSSIVNAVTGQNLSLVSDVKGTTTDPVSKAMELLPLGPVTIIDTAGIRDTSDEIEKIGVKKSKKLIDDAELVIAIFDGTKPLEKDDIEILDLIKDKNAIILLNKIDISQNII